MKTRRWIVPVLLFFVFAGIVAAVFVQRAAVASQSAENFLRLREGVYRTLHERVATPIEGVSVVLPPTESELQRIRQPFPDSEHIQSVTLDQDWFGSGSFQLLLELDESALVPEAQGNSETMAARVLLDHYFADLNTLGFRHRGSHDVVVGNMQSATNEWFNEHDRSITVSGTVCVSPESKQAIVIGTIREWLPKE